MTNPFKQLHRPRPEDAAYDTWGGQFSCMERGCNGYALEARYVKKVRVLSWKCQDGHISKMEDVDE